MQVTGQEFSEAMRITVVTAKPDQPWIAQLGVSLTAGSVKSGGKSAKYSSQKLRKTDFSFKLMDGNGQPRDCHGRCDWKNYLPRSQGDFDCTRENHDL